MSENISQLYLDLNDHSVYYEKFELNNSVGLPTLVFCVTRGVVSKCGAIFHINCVSLSTSTACFMIGVVMESLHLLPLLVGMNIIYILRRMN